MQFFFTRFLSWRLCASASCTLSSQASSLFLSFDEFDDPDDDVIGREDKMERSASESIIRNFRFASWF